VVRIRLNVSSSFLDDYEPARLFLSLFLPSRDRSSLSLANSLSFTLVDDGSTRECSSWLVLVVSRQLRSLDLNY